MSGIQAVRRQRRQFVQEENAKGRSTFTPNDEKLVRDEIAAKILQCTEGVYNSYEQSNQPLPNEGFMHRRRRWQWCCRDYFDIISL